MPSSKGKILSNPYKRKIYAVEKIIGERSRRNFPVCIAAECA